MPNHTPTPWINQGISEDADPSERGASDIIGDNLGGLVAAALPWPTELDAGDFSRVEANAAFIVKAANAHDELVAALRWVRANYAAGSTSEINEVIDAVLAKVEAA